MGSPPFAALGLLAQNAGKSNAADSFPKANQEIYSTFVLYAVGNRNTIVLGQS
jgi:hypothetical protein